ncbi:hypothetical protein [Clostridium kluyveri]|uniref:Uncharacterized protein n=1 Tax=Clostridium kluyveri (strain ATCC 8527 / DSM 555 / NBRC 12016 / NCIMB 10680 / K1) TaxID=431943 RepID=A5F9M0_CLOK5|nr:hypothetical protein [Clostridium kluyveri]ABQ23642.1 hypothetical protein CKL_4043 [Clostridium kluyveri DSM 555]
MAASRVKSVSFKDSEKDLLEFAEKKGDFSNYVKKLIKEDKEKGYKFTEQQKEEIIRLIQKYAPTTKTEDIKTDFDKDALDALGQFDNM